MDGDTQLIDRDVSDGLSEHVRSELCTEWGSFFAGAAGRFKVAYQEDAGYDEDDDDNPLLVRRESDGALFAVQVRAVAVPVLPAAGRAEAIAALPSDGGCWVLLGQCGCPHGVTTARTGESVYAATESEAWRAFYDDWEVAESDLGVGFRVELVSRERYSAEFAPKMLARCPHQAEPAGQMELPEVAG